MWKFKNLPGENSQTPFNKGASLRGGEEVGVGRVWRRKGSEEGKCGDE
jgi:hypothetical protein